MGVFDNVKSLYDAGLHSNVISLVPLLLSVTEHNQNELLLLPHKFQILVYYAESLYQMQDHKKAETIYKRALQLKKSIMKTKGKPASGYSQLQEMTSEIDIKYQIAMCNCQMKQYSIAITALESIPGKQRTARVNMALAKACQQVGMERSAITGYKEVLKECPLALEAAQGLLSLGVKGAEVASLMLSATSTIPNSEWLTTWVKAHSHMHSREFSQAATLFRQLDNRSSLHDNIDVLVCLGEACHYNGEHRNAMAVLQRAHALDPSDYRGMDILASILAKEKKIKELENLAPSLLWMWEQHPEPWVVFAHLSFATKRNNRAIYFAQKACTLNQRCIEALLVKGNILLDIKKVQEATLHFREVLRLAPYRFEGHKGLVDCYTALHRTRDSISYASSACKQLGQSSRALVLYASVLAKDPISVDKAKTVLEKALKLEPIYLDAVYQLAEIYEKEKQFDKGIELLRKQVALQSTCRLHQMLGDFLVRTNEPEKALDHYSAALNLDPNNSRALEGLQRVEQHSDPLDNAYDIEVEDMADSDNEADLEESEVEAVWSDVDFP
uniref:Anaphase-promoting complex subunit 7 n=1 Tax=Strigamia maritima TaxID=126957 RepID=T1J2T0_STRMM